MYKLLLFILACVLGMIIAPLLIGSSGLVMIEFSGYQYEMSTNSFIVAWLITFILLYLIISMGYFIVSSPFLLGRWFKMSLPKRDFKRLSKAMNSFIHGQFDTSAHYLSRVAKADPNLANHLSAALCYIYARKLEKAEQHLEHAAKYSKPDDSAAYKIVQLQYLIQSNKLTDAEALTMQLLINHKNNVQIIKLSYDVFTLNNNNSELIKILPALRKNMIFSVTYLERVEYQLYLEQIQSLFDVFDKKALSEWWDKQPKSIHKNKLISEYYRHVLEQKITT